jgi:hypothetical protein
MHLCMVNERCVEHPSKSNFEVANAQQGILVDGNPKQVSHQR